MRVFSLGILELPFSEEGPGVPVAAAGIHLCFCVFEVEGKGKSGAQRQT